MNVTLAMPSAQLVFGIRWYVLLGASALPLARRYTRQTRASHSILLGHPAALVGVASLRPSRRGSPYYCAAANVARLYPSGTHALIVQVPQYGWWLVAVHDGLPVARTDKFFATREDALSAVQELRQAYSQLHLVGQTDDSAVPTLAQIEAASDPLTRLANVPRITGRSLFVWFLVAGLLLAAGAYWRYVFSSGPALPQLASRPLDAQQAWRKQLQLSLQGLVVHGTAGTRQLLASVAHTPVQQGGWVLSRIGCQSAQNIWSCAAHYRRVARDADTSSLLGDPPQAGELYFPTLDTAIVRWRLPVTVMALGLVRLPDTSGADRTWLSALQNIKAAFTNLYVEPPVPIPVVAPPNLDGHVLARPTAVPVYASRKLHVSGPLRSVALLLPHTRFVSWRSFQVQVGPNPSPSVRTSALMAELQGVSYEKSP